MCARHWKGIGRRRCNLIYRKNRVPLKSVFAAEQISQQKNKIITRKRQNRAFSGCARGKFVATPCRASLASVSAPPLCSRKSRCVAIFREILDLYFIIIECAFENRVSQKAHSICRIPTAFAGKVNAVRVLYGVPSKCAPQRKTPTVSGKSRGPWGCPQTHGKKFYQLKTFFVNYSTSSPARRSLKARARFSAR